ncbi:11466_t:CDS:2, partial [Entrophospora sp. SA101]
MSLELELLRQRVAKLEVKSTKLKQIIEEIANIRIENTKLKQIIKQNRTTNDPSQSLVSPQTPINGHSGEDDNTDSVNLEQIQSAISPEESNMRHSLEVLPLQCSTTPIHIETKSSEDKEIEDFVDRKEKEKVNQESIQKGSFSSDNPTTEVQSAVSSEIVGASTMVLDTEHHFSEIKIPYNQKVEQDEDYLAPSESEIRNFTSSTSHLAHLFDKAKKTGQKEILRWYCYSEEFGKKDKIQQVTHSADAISSLTGVQIQNIINRFPKKNAHVIEPSISNDSEELPETE